MSDLIQAVKGPYIEQSGNWLDFAFDLKDALGEEINFTSGWSARFAVLNRYTDDEIFVFASPSQILMGEDLTLNFETTGIAAYLTGYTYKYILYLTGPNGREYPRLYGLIKKAK